MANPVVRQTRRTLTLSDGSVKYEVTTIIISSGDLPFKELFVAKIEDPAAVKKDLLLKVATPHELWKSDPNNDLYVKIDSTDIITLGLDKFARIPSVDDVTGLYRDRVLAIRNNKTEYLASAITLIYDNLTTADAAYREILSRLSTLVNDWRSYQTNFVTSPYQDYNLPTTTASVETERINTYKAKRDVRIAAEANRDEIQIEKDACVLEGASDKKIYAFLVEDYSFLSRAKNVVNGITETGTTNVKDFVKKQGSYASSFESYENLLIKRQTDMTSYEGFIRTNETNCAQLVTDLSLAQATVDAARIEENNALAAVLAVCPTFDTTV